MEFGLGVMASVRADADPVAEAKLAEAVGFDFVSASDHLHGESATFEPWTLLTWIAAATSRIRVATRVLGLPYRSPAVVAKMAESLDRLTSGRLILGLGGGYADEEFRAFGLGEWSPRDKIDGLEEAITIVKGLWSEPTFTFQGQRYRTEAAVLQPKPEHRIPIWLGTYGPRSLALTGRLADGWIPSHGFAPNEEVTVMRDRVLAAARDAGRDPDEITCVYNLEIRVEEHPGDEESVVAGPADFLIDQLLGFAKLGFDSFNFLPAGPGRDEQIERLGVEVIPAVREGTRAA